MNQLLFNKIKHSFFQALDAKTGWGKEEVKRLYLEMSAATMAQWIDQTAELLPPVVEPEPTAQLDRLDAGDELPF